MAKKITTQTHNLCYSRSSDGLELFYRDYPGPSDRTPVVCLHGLTRNSRDFEDLAPLIAGNRRVLSLDFRGRGHSDHDPDFTRYQPPTYAADTIKILDDNDIDRALIIGTSLGGLVAMIIARDYPGRLAGVVMNDIGPEIAPEGLARIQEYTGKTKPVTSWEEAADQARMVYGDAWRDLDDAMWRRLARRAYRENADGVPVADMDPAIGRAIREAPLDLGDVWELFAALKPVPTLLLRGALTDLLAPETVAKMQQVKPDLAVAEIPNRGHVPLLDEPESLAALDQFLKKVP